MSASTGLAGRSRAPWPFFSLAAGQALPALCLLVAFFCWRTADPLPAVRLHEAWTDLAAHWLAAAAFLFSLGRRLWLRKPVFWKSSLALAVACAIPLAYSAIRSPIRGAALERAAFWVDGLLLFWVARTTLAEAPAFFLALLAGGGALAGAAGLFAGAASSPDRSLAFSTAILAAATLVMGRVADSPRGGLRLQLTPLAFAAIYVLAVSWPLLRGRPTLEERAAAQAARQAPASGFGMGSMPEILPAVAERSWPSLPLPRNGWRALRAESGWEGLAVVCAIAVGALFAGWLALKYRRGETMAAAGLNCLLILLLVNAAARPLFHRPFGLWLFLILSGLLWGLADSVAVEEESAENAAGVSSLKARLAAFAAATALVWALCAFEARPVRAASLAKLHRNEAPTSAFYGYRLRMATRLYPWEATHWTSLGVQRRAVLSTKPFSEIAFQGIVDAYRAAIRANPYCAMAYFGLAQSYSRAERRSDAIAVVRRGLEVLPANEILRQWLATLLVESGDLRGAIAELKALDSRLPCRLSPVRTGESAPLNPAWVRINFKIAGLYESLGDTERAFDEYAAAYAKDPSGPDAREALVAMNRLRKRPEKD